MITAYESNLVDHIHNTTLNKGIDDKVKSICDYLSLCRCIVNLDKQGILTELSLRDSRLSLGYIKFILDEV